MRSSTQTGSLYCKSKPKVGGWIKDPTGYRFRHSRIILSSGVNDEPVLQEGKSKESIGHSRSVFSTPTIPTGNQVTKFVNKSHYPKSFGNSGVVLPQP